MYAGSCRNLSGQETRMEMGAARSGRPLSLLGLGAIIAR